MLGKFQVHRRLENLKKKKAKHSTTLPACSLSGDKETRKACESISHSNPQLPSASLWQDPGDSRLEQTKSAIEHYVSTGLLPEHLSPAPQPGSQQADTRLGHATGSHTTGNRWSRTSGELKSQSSRAAAKHVKALGRPQLELNTAP